MPVISSPTGTRVTCFESLFRVFGRVADAFVLVGALETGWRQWRAEQGMVESLNRSAMWWQ